MHKTSQQNKKYTVDLLPYPLVPFKPIHTANNHYSQLYWPIGKSPYKEAGIKGFPPPQPFCIASHFLAKGEFHDFHFLTLIELNEEVDPFPWINEEEQTRVMLRNNFEKAPILYNGLPLSLAAPIPPFTPILSTPVANIITSSDQLFFISHFLGN
jgi:hypothetical protein